MKRLMGVIFSAFLMCLLFANTAFAADNAQWTTNKYEDWTYTDGVGTNISAKIVDRVLYVSGTGAIPSYSEAYKTPWHGHGIDKIMIDKGITSIGKNAFNDMGKTYRVEMYSNTYIEDKTSFGLYDGARIYVSGMDIADRSTGKISYTSLDSIAEFVHEHPWEYEYVFENYYIIEKIKTGYNDSYRGISPMSVSDTANEKYPLINYKINVTADLSKGMRAGINYCRPSQLCRDIFEVFIPEDFSYMASYRMYASKNHLMVTSTDEPTNYVLTIPNAYKFPNREFKVIQIIPGTVNIFEDLDNDPNTITISTDHPDSLYAIIYKDHFEFLPVQ